MKKIKILFLGTPEFAVPTLEALIANGQSPIAVITEPDRPAGRGKKVVVSPIKQFVDQYNKQMTRNSFPSKADQNDRQIPIFQPEKIKAISHKLYAIKPTLAVVVAYGQIIPKEILKIPKFGFLNIHPSLLPKYRGPSPIQAAILNGDQEAGVSIIKLDEKIDHGPILARQELEIPITKHQIPNKFQITIDYQNLSKKLSLLGANLLIKTLSDYLSGKITPKPQDHTKATYTRLIKKLDGLINWNEPLETIERKIRAYNPWPSSFTFLNKIRVKICQAHIEYDKLVIDKVQPEAKCQMNWKEFRRGNQNFLKYLDKKVKI